MPRRFGSEDLLSWLFYFIETKTTKVLSLAEADPSRFFYLKNS